MFFSVYSIRSFFFCNNLSCLFALQSILCVYRQLFFSRPHPPQVQAESLRQVTARADAKEQALQAARAQDQEAAAQREQALRDEAEVVAAKHKAALAAAQASSHLDGETLVKSTERRVASEYEAHIRTLKVCGSEC